MRAAALAGAIGLFAAGPVLASPLFDAYRAMCGDTAGELTAVKAAVAKARWTATEVNPPAMNGVQVVESQAWTATVGGDSVTLSAWTGTKGNVHVSVCTMRATQAAFSETAKDATSWVGVPAQSALPGKAAWHLTGMGGHMTAVEKTGYDAAAGSPGGLEFFSVSADGPEVVIDLLKIKS